MNDQTSIHTITAFIFSLVLLMLLSLAAAGTLIRDLDLRAAPIAVASPRLATTTTPLATLPLFTATATATGLPITPSNTATATIERPPTETARPTRTKRPTRTPRPSHTPTETPIPPPTSTPSATPRPIPAGNPHFFFRRPIAPQFNDQIALFYPYSSTGENTLPVHHGVEFMNEIGTPVLAAGAGKVIIAQNDETLRIGPHEWELGVDGPFYGNVVVIEHDQRYQDKAVYTLYGHLNTILTTEGARVQAGEAIGEVGMTGVALGPHLHFEVRVGQNDYHTTRNPQLWFPPNEGTGTIVGKILDNNGDPIPEGFVTISYPGDTSIFQFEYAYAIDPAEPTRPDDEWDENFVFSDIPTGRWTIIGQLENRIVRREISVREGEITWVWLAFDEQ